MSEESESDEETIGHETNVGWGLNKEHPGHDPASDNRFTKVFHQPQNVRSDR